MKKPARGGHSLTNELRIGKRGRQSWGRPMQLSISTRGITNGLASLAAAPLIFMASLYICGLYTGGDQIWYRALYIELGRSSLADVPYLQIIHTGSSEPLYGLVMWIGAQSGIDKDIYISVWNMVLGLIMLKIFSAHRVNIVFAALLLGNYYLLVLFFSAERLKFSYILIALAVIVSSRWATIMWVGISPLFHFQSIILFGSRCVGYLGHIKPSRYIKKRTLILAILGLPLCAVAVGMFFYRFSGSMLDKLDAYSGTTGLGSVSSIALLAMASLIVLPRRGEVLFTLGACTVAALIVGPDRVNMIAVTLFTWFTIRDGRTSHPVVITLMAYFSFKSVDFLTRIVAYGDGFYSG